MKTLNRDVSIYGDRQNERTNDRHKIITGFSLSAKSPTNDHDDTKFFYNVEISATQSKVCRLLSYRRPADWLIDQSGRREKSVS